MSEITRTTDNSDIQSPKERSVNDLLANVSEFIDSVYRDLSILSPTSHANITGGQRYSINSSGSPPSTMSSDTSINSTTSPEGVSVAARNNNVVGMSARTQRSIDADIERINRICNTVDENLRSIGLFVNTSSRHGSSISSTNVNNTLSTPNAVRTPPNRPQPRRRRSRLSTNNVDLNQRIETADGHNNTARSESNVHHIDDDDDEVVVVSSDLPTVIDLCTPSYEEPRQATINRNELSRRNLIQHDRQDVIPVRRRRISKHSDDQYDSEREKSVERDSVASTVERTPFMCPVCMDSCLQRKPTSTKCGHVFCEKCIRQAVRLTHKCPICNTKISCSQLFRIYV